MTQKSLARRMRDQEQKDRAANKEKLKENTCWDDLNQIYSSCVSLLKQHGHISSLAQNKELLECVVDARTLVTNIRQLAGDVQSMHQELQALHAQHAGKAGGSQDPDEVMRTITIYEQYTLFMERHQGVVMPTAYYILEQFDQAEKILQLKTWNASIVAKGAPATPEDGQSWWCDAENCYYKWMDGAWFKDNPTETLDVEVIQTTNATAEQPTVH